MKEISRSLTATGLLLLVGCATIPVRPNIQQCRLDVDCVQKGNPGMHADLVTANPILLNESPANAIILNQTFTLSDLGITQAQFATNAATFVASAVNVDLSQSNVSYTTGSITATVTLLNSASPLASTTITIVRSGSSLIISNPGAFTSWVASNSAGANSFSIRTGALGYTPVLGTNTNTVLGNYNGQQTAANSVSGYATDCQMRINSVNPCPQ
jgi:hypothetical protein